MPAKRRIHRIPVRFVYQGQFLVPADSREAAEAIVRTNCGMTSRTGVNSTDPEVDWVPFAGDSFHTGVACTGQQLDGLRPVFARDRPAGFPGFLELLQRVHGEHKSASGFETWWKRWTVWLPTSN